jgi:hypothetical protein
MRHVLTFLRYLAVTLMICASVIVLGRAVTWLRSSDDQAGLSGPLNVFVWDEPFDGFGGYSALIIDPDGVGFIAGSDRQHYLTGRLERDPNGHITQINDVTYWPVRLGKNSNVTRFQGDLEGLTRMADGRIGMAFENYARIQIMEAPGEIPRSVHKWDVFAGVFGNEVFEAIATLPDGTVLAVFEHDHQRGQGGRQTYMTTPAYHYDGENLTGPSRFPVTKGYDVSGADLGPDGCLYVLERHYGLLSGFQFQLIRMDPYDWQAGRTLLYRSKPMHLGNAEGISVWQNKATLTATLITDDGFPPTAATRIIELPLRPVPNSAHGCAGQ